MSRAPGDEPPYPRRPGPPGGSSSGKGPGKPPRDSFESDSSGSTFRPNPARPGPVDPSAAKKRRRSAGEEPVAPDPKWWERIVFGSVGSGQLSQFCRQFAAYLHAGVDYSKALSSLQKQFAMTALGPAIDRLRLGIKSGSTLEEAMAREPRIFNTMFLSMIRVAEARGGVPETLRMLGEHYEARQRLIRQAQSAMIYPIIVLVIAGGVIALITVVLLPMFASLLKDISRKAELPWASRTLLGSNSFIQYIGWWMIPVVMIGVPFFLLRWYRTNSGKAVLDRVLLCLPVFGKLLRKLDTSRFARTLATLLDAGVDVGSSIELTAQVVNMAPMRDAVRNSRDQVMAGKELSEALAGSRQFSDDVLAILNSGEETGKLPESLNHLADDYEEQVSLMVKNMGHLIQPLLVLILGGVVFFIILAVFLPYIQVLTSLSSP